MKTLYVPYTKSVHETRNVTSHEHRAPTDESVRLLREMEEKARDSVFATIKCESTHFNVSAMVWEDHMNMGLVVRSKFTLGDQTHDVETLVPARTTETAESRQKVVLAIRDQLAREIANQITITALQDSVLFRR